MLLSGRESFHIRLDNSRQYISSDNSSVPGSSNNNDDNWLCVKEKD